MHRSDVEQCDVGIHARFGVNITALTDIGSAVHVLAVLVFVTGECIDDIFPLVLRVGRLTSCQIGVHQVRVPFFTKDDASGKAVGRIVYRHSGNSRQDLTSSPIAFKVIEQCFGSQNVVVAVFGDLFPTLFRNRLIPRKPQLLMVNAELNFPLFQTLLLGREVINIRIRKIIRFAKLGIAIFLHDDSLGQMVQLGYRIAEKTCVHHMVIVISVVKSDQTIPNEAFDVLRRWVDHTNDRVFFSRKLPVHKEEVWKYLAVKERDRNLIIDDRI